MKQIEVNGMIYEFDEKLLLKQEIRVGDNVQLLVKESYSSKPDLYSGVVTQILPFSEDLPAIEVMYIDNTYSSFQIKKRVITNDPDCNAKIIKTDDGFLPFTRDSAIDMLDHDIRDKERALREAKEKKEYFIRYYNRYFEKEQEA